MFAKTVDSSPIHPAMKDKKNSPRSYKLYRMINHTFLELSAVERVTQKDNISEAAGFFNSCTTSEGFRMNHNIATGEAKSCHV
jgi:hypothetical protein